MRNPSDILDDARELLEDPRPPDRSQYAVQPYSILPQEELLPQPVFEIPSEKFETLPEDLRNDETGINFYSAKRKLLATLIEALEQAVGRYQTTGSPESGLLVGSISNQVQRTMKDLEKSQDPRNLYDQIEDEIFTVVAQGMVKVLSSEIQGLLQECENFIPRERQAVFIETVKLMTKRCGPAFDDQLNVARTKLKEMLNIKDKKVLKDTENDPVVPGL